MRTRLRNLLHRGSLVRGTVMILCVLGIGSFDRSHAAITTYFDRTAWETAVGTATLTEDLEGFVADESFNAASPPVAINGMILSESGHPQTPNNRIDVLPLEGTGVNAPNGSAFVLAAASLDLDAVDPDRTTIVELTFNAPVSAFGADFNGIDGVAQGVIDVFDTFSTLLATIDAPDDLTFIGIQATGGEQVKFLRFRASEAVAREAFGFDNIAVVSDAEVDPVPVAALEDLAQPAGSEIGSATVIGTSGALALVGGPSAISNPDDPVGDQVVGGKVDLYRLDGTGAWVQEATLVANDLEVDAAFGASLDIAPDESMITIGAPLKDCTGAVIADCGAVYVFRQQLDGTWLQDATLVSPAPSPGDEFGGALAMTNETVVIGAPGEDSGVGADTGETYVFNNLTSGAFLETSLSTLLTGSDILSAGARFGESVDIETSVTALRTVIVGAPIQGVAGEVYQFESASPWQHVRRIVSPDANLGDRFGASVSLSGTRFAIGAPRDSDPVVAEDPIVTESGSVYVYTSGTTTTLEAKIKAAIPQLNARLGTAVALLDQQLLVGAPGASDSTVVSGLAYLFERNSPWAQRTILRPTSLIEEGQFGRSVSLATSVALVGEPSAAAEAPGKATVYSVPESEGPLTSGVLVAPNPVAVNTLSTLTATVDDTTTGGSLIASAAFTIDGGSATSMSAQDSSFDQVNENVSATIPAFEEAGVHTVCVRGTDGLNNIGLEDCVLLAVFDAEGGFVTGGGWMTSPEGAYTADPSLTGKANFGFFSKYKKGATTPTGATQFRFKVADLNFHSDTYDWLVVAGARAQYKGTGTINGSGEYGFMLTAIDGALPGGNGVDRFRIKIWNKQDASLIYDNQLGADDNGNDATELGGGSIKIHKK